MEYFLLPPVIVVIFICAVFAIAALFGLMLDVLGRFRCWCDKKHAQARAYKELNQLTDIELKDIGITRGDISRVARGTYFWG